MGMEDRNPGSPQDPEYRKVLGYLPKWREERYKSLDLYEEVRKRKGQLVIAVCVLAVAIPSFLKIVLRVSW